MKKMPIKYAIIFAILSWPLLVVFLVSLLTPAAHHAENTALYKNNGITIKLYGVRNETRNTTSRGHDKMAKIIAYFIGIFFIVNHHCIKL